MNPKDKLNALPDGQPHSTAITGEAAKQLQKINRMFVAKFASLSAAYIEACGNLGIQPSMAAGAFNAFCLVNLCRVTMICSNIPDSRINRDDLIPISQAMQEILAVKLDAVIRQKIAEMHDAN